MPKLALAIGSRSMITESRIDAVIPWPLITRGKNKGKPFPALTLNFHLSPIAAAQRSRRIRKLTADIVGPNVRESATGHCTLRLVNIVGPRQRELDKDGLYAKLKPVVDGLRDCGAIYRDEPKWLDYEATQEIDRANGPAVRVSVERSDQ